MLRTTLRDEIRALAEVEGSSSMTGLINLAIQDVIDSLTALARYDELFTPNHELAIAANGIVTLPADFQHLDETEIYFLRDGDDEEGNKRRLHRFSRIRSVHTGWPRQWRLFGTGSSGEIVRKLELTPHIEIVTANDKLWINYYRKCNWNTDFTALPIPRFGEYIKLKVAARIAKQTNTKLAQRLLGQARDAYIALRAGVY